MEINETYLFIVGGVIGLVFIISLFNLIINRRILKRYSGKLVKVVSIYEIESSSLEHKYKTTFFNNNFSDVKVQNIGYIYNNQEFSFFTEIKDARNIKDTDYVIVEDNITLEQTYSEIKAMILGILKDKSKVKQLYAFLTDSDGNVTKRKTRQLRKNIIRNFKEELKEERAEQKKIKEEMKLERRKQGISAFDDFKSGLSKRFGGNKEKTEKPKQEKLPKPEETKEDKVEEPKEKAEKKES